MQKFLTVVFILMILTGIGSTIYTYIQVREVRAIAAAEHKRAEQAKPPAKVKVIQVTSPAYPDAMPNR